MRRLISGTRETDAAPFGLLLPEDPGLQAPDARLFWRADHDPSIVQVVAERVSPDCADRFDPDRLGVPALVLKASDGCEYLSLSDGFRRVRLDLLAGSFREGQVRLHYRLAGLQEVEPKLLALHRLLALCRLGRFARGLNPPERAAHKWILTLRAWDAVHAGASQREIASELFGAARVNEDWRRDSDYLRGRVQRLVRNGDALVSGGYRELLGNVGASRD